MDAVRKLVGEEVGGLIVKEGMLLFEDDEGMEEEVDGSAAARTSGDSRGENMGS